MARKENSLYITTFLCHSIPPGGRFQLRVVWKRSPDKSLFFTLIYGHTPAENMCLCMSLNSPSGDLIIAALPRRVSARFSAHLHSLTRDATFHEFNFPRILFWDSGDRDDSFI
jgi:hypothetical protein